MTEYCRLSPRGLRAGAKIYIRKGEITYYTAADGGRDSQEA